MKKEANAFTRSSNRRAFFKNGAVTAGAAALSAGLLTSPSSVLGQEDGGSPINQGRHRHSEVLERVSGELGRASGGASMRTAGGIFAC